MDEQTEQAEIVAVYCDGGIIPDDTAKNKNPSPIGGTWAWCHVDAQGNRVKEGWGMILTKGMPTAWGMPPNYCPYDTVENNLSEFFAAAMALNALPAGWSGFFFTDHQNTIGRLWGWEGGRRYKMKGVPDSLARYAEKRLQRLGEIDPILLDGHPNKQQLAQGIGKNGRMVSEHQVWCDEKATFVSKSYRAMLRSKGYGTMNESTARVLISFGV